MKYSRFELAAARHAMRYSMVSSGDLKEHWITLEGGTHVQVDGNGNITGGPAGLKEKGITSLSHFGGKSEKSESNLSTTVDSSKPPADTTPVASDGDAGKKTGVEGEKMDAVKKPLRLVSERWLEQNRDRHQLLSNPEHKEAAKREYAQAIADREAALGAIGRHGFIRNRYPFTAKNGKRIQGGEGWIKKNKQTERWENFSSVEAMGFVNSQEAAT